MASNNSNNQWNIFGSPLMIFVLVAILFIWDPANAAELPVPQTIGAAMSIISGIPMV